MHDKNGRELKKGDTVRLKDYTGKHLAGVITAAFPGSVTCNITVATPVFGGFTQGSYTAKESELIVTVDGELPEVREVAVPAATSA